MDYEKFTKLHEANCKIRHTELSEVFRVLELIRTLNNLRKNEAVDDDEFLTLKDFIIRKVDPVYKVPPPPTNIDEDADDDQVIDKYEKSKVEVGGPKVVEKDGILDGEITNTPVKRFKDDFNRINNGDLPEANYY